MIRSASQQYLFNHLNTFIMKKILITLSFATCCIANMQGQFLERAVNRAKDKAIDRANNKIDRAIDKGLDKVEEGLSSPQDQNTTTYPNAQTPQPVDNSGNYNNNVNNSYPTNQQPAAGNNGGGHTDYSAYKGSSFIPGKNVIFFEDFSNTAIGNGANNWHLYEYDAYDDVERPSITSLPGQSGRWYKMPRKGFTFPNSFSKLPEQFTIEFDLYADPKTMSEMEGGFNTIITSMSNRKDLSMYFHDKPAINIDVHPHGPTSKLHFQITTEYQPNKSTSEMTFLSHTYSNGWKSGAVNRVSISRNGPSIIVFVNGKEYANIANALPKKADYHIVFATNQWGYGLYFTNLRIAGDIPNATKEIQQDGKFVTNAIYFDVNSSRIKPESWATLNEAAKAIKATSGKILIVGHTDSDGSDDSNMKLSKTRAESVKNALVKEFGIDGSRLTVDGKGESQPVTSNNSAVGKAQNRRVEFIKL